MRVPIRLKLAGVYLIIIAAMTLTIVRAFNVTKKIYIDEIGRSSLLLSEEMFKRMDQRLFHLVGQLHIQTRTESVQAMLSLSNSEFDRFEDAGAYIREKDQNWTSTPPKTITPFMKSLIENPIALNLKDIFIDSYDELYGFTLIQEIIVTNRYGANVAVSDRTTDYFQADEHWWLEARDKGIYIGPIVYDESVSSYGIDLGVRIDDDKGRLAGILLVGLDVKDIIREAEVGTRKFSTTQIRIVTEDGRLIYSTRPYRFLEDVRQAPFFRHLPKKDGYMIIDGPRPELFSFTHSRGFKYFKGFGWTLIISHHLDDALKPYYLLQKRIIIVASFVVLLCLTLIFLLTKSITSPLKSLSQGLKSMSEGRLDQGIDVVSNDELGDLASAFNLMLERRQQAEEALSESERRFRAIFEQAAVGVALIETKTRRFIEINHKYCDILGYPPEEATQLNISAITHPDDLATDLDNSERLQRGEIHEYSMEKRYVRKDGSVVWVNLAVSSLSEKGEQPEHHIAVAEDITGRKIAEQERANMEIRLQQIQKIEAIGTLAGGIAHDFNNILSAILGYAELALMELPDDDRLKPYLNEIFKAGNRARELTKQILTFSRQDDQVFEPVRLKSIIEEAGKLLRATLPATVEIRQNLTDDSFILGNPTQIHQVMMNLGSNAGHAMQGRSGLLELELKRVQFDLKSAAEHPGLSPGPYLKLSVSDNGSGMSPEVLNRIFDPFFTTKEVSKGTGMGLAVVHGLVKSHGGAIAVQSAPGKGSRFDIYFPIVEQPVEPQVEAAPVLAMGNERILFVDDEEFLVNVGKQLLARLGYEVTATTSSLKALNIFRDGPDTFDLVVTDMTMPSLTGEKLAKEMLSIRPDVPIILCTGYSEAIDETSAKDLGIKAFIMKPLTSNNLAATIREILDKQD